jgi:hypothetical protein
MKRSIIPSTVINCVFLMPIPIREMAGGDGAKSAGYDRWKHNPTHRIIPNK